MERIEFRLAITLIGLILVASGVVSIEFFPVAGIITALAGLAMVVTVWL